MNGREGGRKGGREEGRKEEGGVSQMCFQIVGHMIQSAKGTLTR